MKIQKQINYSENLYCYCCKEQIEYEEKFLMVFEIIYGDEIIEKPHHIECVPEDDDVYISKD